MHSQYYEAILQVRDAPEEVYKAVAKAIDAAARKGVFVSKVEKSKNGLDYYLSSKRFAVNLGKQLKKRFRGQVKLSRKLYGRDRSTSKTLYRVTVLYRHLKPEDINYRSRH
ncbi:hypothetical protein JXB11_00045 [Candidatus Woesearchaeota archaeon]|nr:hypothetical protein [Candidatus Woesearchaeota archaeon]